MWLRLAFHSKNGVLRPQRLLNFWPKARKGVLLALFLLYLGQTFCNAIPNVYSGRSESCNSEVSARFGCLSIIADSGRIYRGFPRRHFLMFVHWFFSLFTLAGIINRMGQTSSRVATPAEEAVDPRIKLAPELARKYLPCTAHLTSSFRR